MKALDILYKIDTEYKYAYLDRDSCIRSDYINEAIAELEVLKSRSCESCKHCRQFAELGLCDVLRGYTNMHLIKYCGRWESKK